MKRLWLAGLLIGALSYTMAACGDDGEGDEGGEGGDGAGGSGGNVDCASGTWSCSAFCSNLATICDSTCGGETPNCGEGALETCEADCADIQANIDLVPEQGRWIYNCFAAHDDCLAYSTCVGACAQAQ